MPSHRVHRLQTLAGSAALIAILSLVAPGRAAAESTIRSPNPPRYAVEIEPHLNLGVLGWDYGGTSFGPGIRFGIPIMSPGFIPTINDSVAISVGADFVRYAGYQYACDNAGCYDTAGFWAAYVPVTLQWNFWLTDRWSVFGEPGLALRHSFQDDYCTAINGFSCRGRDRLLGSFYVGARLHLTDALALTLRVGYPTGLSIGLSIF
jgi:hypothetical protein